MRHAWCALVGEGCNLIQNWYQSKCLRVDCLAAVSSGTLTLRNDTEVSDRAVSKRSMSLFEFSRHSGAIWILRSGERGKLTARHRMLAAKYQRISLKWNEIQILRWRERISEFRWEMRPFSRFERDSSVIAAEFSGVFILVLKIIVNVGVRKKTGPMGPPYIVANFWSIMVMSYGEFS